MLPFLSIWNKDTSSNVSLESKVMPFWGISQVVRMTVRVVIWSKSDGSGARFLRILKAGGYDPLSKFNFHSNKNERMKKWQLEFHLWVKPVAGNEIFVESQ